MKKIVLFFLLICGLVQAQDVAIPDANFLTKLLEANPSNQIAYGGGGYIKIDSNDDGLIQVTADRGKSWRKVDNIAGAPDTAGGAWLLNRYRCLWHGRQV